MHFLFSEKFRDISNGVSWHFKKILFCGADILDDRKVDIKIEVIDLNIAVCDDEKVIREQIKELIEEQSEAVNIKLFTSGEELLACDEVFDIIFLDIQMGGLSGIETARILRKQESETIIIFVTAVKEYVFEAFDVEAFHYLLKPIEDDKFVEVFERAMKGVLARKTKMQERIFIKTRNRNITIHKSRILYVESRTRKVEIHLNNECIETYATMNEMEKQLGEGFYRCHRGYLVNMAYILEYDTSKISLNNGEEIYMAKEKYSDFVKEYMRYLKGGGGTFV